jgi:RNA 2',3'-cyclic 3'-phosphodiesterase
MMRLFIAIEIPDDIKNDLTALLTSYNNIRQVSKGQIHLTLKFVGKLDHNQTEMLKSELESICFKPFELKLEGAGFFPGNGVPRVYWIGVSRNDSLFELQEMIEVAAVRVGAEKEKYSYKPHVTLGRFKNDKINKDELKSTGADYESRIFTVQYFALFESRLTPEGAIHKIVSEYSLK